MILETNGAQFFIVVNLIKCFLEVNQYHDIHQALILTLKNFIMQKREGSVCPVVFPKS